MPVRNAEIAEIFEKLADLLAIKGENQFRIRAYRNAARTISGLQSGVRELVERGEELSDYQGIGKAIAEKIVEIVETGTLSQLEELTKELPEGLLDLLRIPELGPRRVKELYEELEITNIDALASALEDGRVRELEGFGEKLEQSLLSQVKAMRDREEEHRLLLPAAEEVAEEMVAYLKKHGDVKRIAVAGSYRRRKQTVGDLDILVVAGEGSAGGGGAAAGGIMDVFTGHEDVRRVSMKGETRSSVVLRSGVQIDLRVLEAESYGSALQYFTGSKEHNIAVRRVAQEQGLKVSEYGIFRGDEQVAGAEEEEMYTTLGLAWVPPELREDRGEVEAARAGALPELVTVEDIRGDLHSHTNASDGSFTLEEMAEAAQARGYEYLAVSDHSKSLTVARGLDEDRLARQIDDIAELNESFDGFRLLRSIEVDILDDGRLDLSDEILARLDLVICSIHSGLNKTEEKQTERIIRAMDNPHCSIIGHPTGRLLGSRDAYPVNMQRLLEAAAERGVSFEINAQPERLDLRDEDAHAARELGIRISIATDAHAPANLAFMRYGVDQARRGWLRTADVLNTRPWSELGPLLKRG
ncbi:MAG: DNA polymerase/3'-5' exonuclease PolX [Spirochaetes bacterium]|jgi:DNA polymerase (family 10)|nr:DNA polymerase/3'-5' exonuclease PolX [Spirochaetota bacterium]